MRREEAAAVKTTCPYCGVGCGVVATRRDDGSVDIKGDPDHPASFGRLCSKGTALAETIDLDGRLLHPEIEGKRATWDEALNLVAKRFNDAICNHGPDSVAFYVSGQLLTEDYYVANKLMKGFIGSANIDTNSRLCMASSVAGHKRAFGSDTVPGTYADLEEAELVVLAGSNLAWCHPVLYQRLAAAKEKRPEMKVILVDPRRTMTAAIADLHLAIKPDGDVALFNGLLCALIETGAIDEDYVREHTSGFAEAINEVRSIRREDTIELTGLSAAEISAFYKLFSETEKTITVFSQGVNQSVCGTDKVNAIINCHLATGRIGRPGMGPFSVTGQPNAMGGREVGGLASSLAVHMDIEDAAARERVQRFWSSPVIAGHSGLKALDLFKAAGQGHIKALWIMGTNPVDSMPEASAVEDALRVCPFVAISDVTGDTDTIAYANVRLPAAAWGEKDGTVTNSERRISRQRAFLPLPGEARPDWQIVDEVANRMGFAIGFGYTAPGEIFAEHAALSGFENNGERDFDIGAWATISRADYASLEPFQWPARCNERKGDTRFFAAGGFYTADARARFVAVTSPARIMPPAEYPMTLSSGRVRDHWHTMTRTGKSQRLSVHLAEPYAEIHPGDGLRLGIRDAGLVRVKSSCGEIVVRALLSERQAENSVFVPMHWTDRFASNARVNKLLPSIADPHSGQPALKNIQVHLNRYDAAWYGFAVLRSRPGNITSGYWALARCAGGWRVELGGQEHGGDWASFAGSLLDLSKDDTLLAYHDEKSGQHRFAAFDTRGLIGALYIARNPVRVSRSWAVQQLAAGMPALAQRSRILAGRSGVDSPDPGAMVCACFSIGINQITTALDSDRGCSVEDIGRLLKAGTNCGSCRSEIRAIIDANRIEAAE